MTQPLIIAQKRADKLLPPPALDRDGLEGPAGPWNFEFLAAEIKLRLEIFLETARPECIEPALFET